MLVILFKKSWSKPIGDYVITWGNPAMPFHLWLRSMAQDRLIDAQSTTIVVQHDGAYDREQPLQVARFLDQSTIDLGRRSLIAS